MLGPQLRAPGAACWRRCSQLGPLLLTSTAVVCLARLPPVESATATQQFALKVPRVTEAELQANATLRTGLHPYILTGHIQGRWKAEAWTLDYLAKKIPWEWVDFYTQNLDEAGKKPHLFKLKDALPRFRQGGAQPRYMQLRLSYRGWQRLRRDLEPKPLPDFFWSDEEWISACMQKDGKPDTRAIDNFYTTNQWKFLLVGEKGTSMFFHKDGTAASSWQAQLVGRKKWTLCPNDQTRLLNENLQTFSPEGQRDPNFAKAYCGQVVVEPGELLYYPGYWWHHTLQLETPSIAYTGALVGTEVPRNDVGRDRRPHAAFLNDVKRKCAGCWKPGKPERTCDDISKKWPGAAPPPSRVVCDEYLLKCFELWDAHAKTLTQPSRSSKSEL